MVALGERRRELARLFINARPNHGSSRNVSSLAHLFIFARYARYIRVLRDHDLTVYPLGQYY